MKILLLSLLLSLLISVVAAAEERQLHIEYSYDKSVTPITHGFVLYQSGVEVCSTDVIDITQFDCMFETLPGTHSYTLAATFTDGSIGLPSQPYVYTLEGPTDPETPLIPIILRLVITELP